MSVNLVLDTKRIKRDNTYPIKITIYQMSANISLNTGLSVEVSQWNNGKVVLHPQGKTYNSILCAKKGNVELLLLKLSMSNKFPPSSKELVKIIKNVLKTGEPDNFEEISKIGKFVSYYDRVLQSKEKKSTKEIYAATLKKICSFETDIQNFTFEKLNISWIKQFENYLREQGLSINARSIHLRNIRAVCNSAIDDEVALLNTYPFRRYKILGEETRKRCLSVEQLKKIRDIECEQYLVPYKDIFMLGFYLIGINLIDLLNLKYESIVNGRVEYRREKTGRLYSIKLEPEALKIIEKYKGAKNLLNIMDRYQDYRNYSHRINKNLKNLQTDLSTYWARHTWATFAAELDIPKETIAAALGHGATSTTDIYINFNHKKVDEANRKVIDYLNG